MVRNLLEHLAEVTSRRGFLNSAISAAGAVALVLVGVKPGYATGTTYPVACCHLAKDPATCTYGNCSCEWHWPCSLNNGDGTCSHYLCYECYSASVCPGSATSNSKTGAICSKAVYVPPDYHCGGGCLAPGPDCPCGHKPC
jgi:hypothetical protein